MEHTWTVLPNDGLNARGFYAVDGVVGGARYVMAVALNPYSALEEERRLSTGPLSLFLTRNHETTGIHFRRTPRPVHHTCPPCRRPGRWSPTSVSIVIHLDIHLAYAVH